VDEEESMRTLHAAVDSGVNSIDTADVYGDGRSERLVAQGITGTCASSAYSSSIRMRDLPTSRASPQDRIPNPSSLIVDPSSRILDPNP
jgi:Aldo/keto reductase family